ncbi:MAG: DUF2804 domain-containing protein [Chloroflexi bacterium]|nr:DUF2804 domain-containing protein [Chloroflexota bacterium]
MKEVVSGEGYVINPGFSTSMDWNFDKSKVHTRESRIKEWEFYQLLDGDWVFQATVGHASIFGSYSVRLFNLMTKESYSLERLEFHTAKNLTLQNNPDHDYKVEVKRKNFFISYELFEGKKIIRCKGISKTHGECEIEMLIPYDYDNEKMVILTPFHESKKMFFLNQKENYYKASLKAKFGNFSYSSDGFYGVMDFGRGYWPYHHEWYWGNAAFDNGGTEIAWNIGWGFGNLSCATENVVFIDRKALKLGTLIAKIDISRPMDSKVIIDDDRNIFHLEMEPIYDNVSKTHVLWIDNCCHQVFYSTCGYIIEGGKKIEFKDKITFLEHAENHW